MTEKYRYYLFLWKEKWQQFYVLKNIYKIIFQLADIITFFKIDFFTNRNCYYEFHTKSYNKASSVMKLQWH